MKTVPPAQRRNDYFLLVFILSFLIPLTLFIFRTHDDNRLTSWNWAFSGIDASLFFFILIAGLLAAYFLSKLDFPERRPLLFLFTASTLASIFFWREPEVIVDASRYFTQAKHLKEYGPGFFITEWGRSIDAWTDLPLMPFLFGLIFKLFGESRLYIQIFTSLLYTMTVVCTYYLGKSLWNSTIGFYGGFLLLGMPYLFTQVPLMLVDIATMSLLILAVVTVIQAITQGGIWLPISSLSIFLAFYSKYSVWLMFTVLFVIFGVFILQKSETSASVTNTRVRYLQRGMVVAASSVLLIASVALYKMDVIMKQIDILMTYQKPALKGWSESFVSTYLFQIHPFITIAAILSTIVAIKRRDLRYLFICWLVILMVYLSVKRIRYVLPTFPMLSLMAAYALHEIRDAQLRRYVGLSAVTTALIVALVIYLPFLQRMSSANIKDAALYMNGLDASQFEVVTLPSRTYNINPSVSVPLLDLYTHKKIHYAYKESTPPERIKTSPLRFTWKYRNPDYYKNSAGNNDSNVFPLVVITSENNEELPESVTDRVRYYKKSPEFSKTTNLFRYSPSVLVYEPE